MNYDSKHKSSKAFTFGNKFKSAKSLQVKKFRLKVVNDGSIK